MNLKLLVAVLISGIAVTGCGEPKIDCYGLNGCNASALNVAADLKMSDLETKKFVGNYAIYPLVKLLNQFKHNKSKENLDSFIDVLQSLTYDEKAEKVFVSTVNGKTAKEINDYVNNNQAAIKVINELRSINDGISSVKQMVELCEFDTGSLTDCNSGNKADPSKNQRGWNLTQTYGFNVNQGVITKEIKGDGYTIIYKWAKIGESYDSYYQIGYSYY